MPRRRPTTFHAERGFTNDPKRCPDCRAARRNERGGDGSGGGYGYSSGGGYGSAGGYGGGRQMFDVTCSACGKATRVPFQPRGDRPVYCSDCFRQQGGGRTGRGGAGGYGRGGRY